MNSKSVDLIYLDPPFNSNKNYFAPIGSSAQGVKFEDVWRMSNVKEEWIEDIQAVDKPLWSVIAAAGLVHSEAMKAYLAYMSVRLIEMGRVLKDTGSIYLHCDPTASHYLKLLMDAIFGRKSFRNEIVWHYRNASRGKRKFANSHDLIHWYSAGTEWTFNRKDILQEFDSGMTKWRYTKGGQRGKTMPQGKTPDDVIVMPSLNAMAKERTGYPTQKPLALLKHIIKAGSNEGDIICDPFCGCATTLVAAETLGRQWLGIDIEEKARLLIVSRLQRAADEGALLLHNQNQLPDIVPRTDTPSRTDLGTMPHYTRHKKSLFADQDGRCKGCDDRFDQRNLEVDHIVPRSKGGQDNVENLQLLCGYCNRTKGRGTQEELLMKLRERGYLPKAA